MIRIIGGRWRGKKLQVVDRADLRPTTDRMRERLFSILQHPRYPALSGARVADLFAGSGALGLEAASRGARHVTFVDQSKDALSALRQNLPNDAEEGLFHPTLGNAAKPGIAKAPYDMVFLDPPYGKGLVPKTLAYLPGAGWLKEGTVIIAESHKQEPLEALTGYTQLDQRIQGIQCLTFLEWTGE